MRIGKNMEALNFLRYYVGRTDLFMKRLIQSNFKSTVFPCFYFDTFDSQVVVECKIKQWMK